MHKVVFTKHSEKQLKKLVSRNKVVNNLLKKKFTASLPQINLEEALKSEKVKLVSGISPATLDLLKEKKFDPAVYEYRDFPRRLPFRMYFVNRENTFVVLEILHHQEIKSAFTRLLIDTVRKNVL